MIAIMWRSLKKVLQSRVELRIVAILLSLAALVFGALMFGAFMKDGAERSAPRGGALGRVAFRFGATPENLFPRLFREPDAAEVFALALQQRFPGRSGLDFAAPLRSTPSGGAGAGAGPGGGGNTRAKR